MFLLGAISPQQLFLKNYVKNMTANLYQSTQSIRTFLNSNQRRKEYKVIACARNPLDISVSYYTKMINDSSGNFTDEKLLRKMVGILK